MISKPEAVRRETDLRHERHPVFSGRVSFGTANLHAHATLCIRARGRGEGTVGRRGTPIVMPPGRAPYASRSRPRPALSGARGRVTAFAEAIACGSAGASVDSTASGSAARCTTSASSPSRRASCASPGRSDARRARRDPHTPRGGSAPAGCGSRDLSPALPYVLHHHERWDGTGYPHGPRRRGDPDRGTVARRRRRLRRDDLDRPYRPALSVHAALAELERCAGSQFDPARRAGVPRRLARGRDTQSAAAAAAPPSAGSERRPDLELRAHAADHLVGELARRRCGRRGRRCACRRRPPRGTPRGSRAPACSALLVGVGEQRGGGEDHRHRVGDVLALEAGAVPCAASASSARGT